MNSNKINAKMLAKMFLAGAKNLEVKKEWINELNVFPVPDGDTGTNMTLTIMSAAKEVVNLQDEDMMTICKAISSGSLRGARGNSGVILSQLFRGFTKTIREYEEIDIPTLATATEKAVESAYKAVMKPKEGTILTVAKGMADKARELAEEGCDDMELYFRQIIEYGDEVLAKTPDMLPVLKQAGVVDSGGQGLMQVMKGAFDAFLGKEVDFTLEASKESSAKGGPASSVDQEIKYGYCTEFIILLNKTFNIKNEIDFKEYLESIGDSIVVVADGDVVKVHVHTNDPGLAIQRALKYGALSNMKIDNMRLEHQEKVIKEQQMKEQEQKKGPEMPHKEVGFIAVSVGEGMSEIFRGLGADYIIEGGQTMNPSTEDMLNAIDRVNADTIFILPNNKNIILAANQAQTLTEDKDIIVVPSKTVPQGITAIINYMPDADAQTNLEAMIEGIGNVKTGQVTYAVRDTHIDDKEIHEGDIMGIGDSGILAVGQSVEETTKEMLAQLVDEDTELISLYYGQDVQEESAENFAQEIEDLYPDVDVDVHSGGQPIYYYVLSVE